MLQNYLLLRITPNIWDKQHKNVMSGTTEKGTEANDLESAES